MTMPSLSQILKSKTLLFGFLLMIASVAQVFVPYLPQEYVGIAGASISAVVIALRFITTIPVTDK